MKNTLNQSISASRSFCFEQEGATATEYAVILTLVIVAVVGAAALFGFTFSGTTSAVYSNLSGATDSGGGGSFGPGNLRTNTSVKMP